MRTAAKALPGLRSAPPATAAPQASAPPARPVVHRMTTISRQPAAEAPAQKDPDLERAPVATGLPVAQRKTIRVGD